LYKLDTLPIPRAKVLKSLLDREQLFLTDIGKSAFEAAARGNMTHEWRLVFGGQLLQQNTLGEFSPGAALMP